MERTILQSIIESIYMISLCIGFAMAATAAWIFYDKALKPAWKDFVEWFKWVWFWANRF